MIEKTTTAKVMFRIISFQGLRGNETASPSDRPPRRAAPRQQFGQTEAVSADHSPSIQPTDDGRHGHRAGEEHGGDRHKRGDARYDILQWIDQNDMETNEYEQQVIYPKSGN
ncbi:MAG TPA: hypothetical protein VLU73_17985 [Methylococcaceae bacterium]|nr:hypothetical protein [Methylococcaceae bacterium]